MATREEIEADLAAIEARLRSGAHRVSYQDNEVWFDFKTLEARRRELKTALQALDATPRRARRVLTRTRKGL